MATAIHIATDTSTYAVPIEDVKTVAHELRRLDAGAYPSAAPLATILEAACEDELGADVKIEPLEAEALDRVLHGLDVAEDITDPLRALWIGLRYDSAR